ncbi:MAG: glycosyltransferase [Gammaproteobacteria bacterium]|nr:glycosyltransferase [Gammaproteobacteria bacterium]
MSVILIGVPTCGWPVMLAACLESIGRMAFPADAEVRLAVADNDAAESARKVVEEFARRAPLPVDYSVCPERGLSNIRNHLLDRALAAGADILDCVDDDCTVGKTWLADAFAAIKKTGADAVNSGAPMENAQLSTCGIVMSKRIFRDLNMRYDPRFNFTGSEDTDFARRALAAGARMVQAPFPAVRSPAYGHREGMRIYLYHHFARYVAESHARRVRDGKPAMLIVAAAVAYLLKGIILAPAAILSRKQRMRCIKSLLKTAGYARSLFGPGKAEPYRDVSGF